MSEEYVVQFDSHGDAHEASIDLECFARALKPYLRLPDAFQKLEKKHIEVPSHLPEDCMPECKYWMPTPSPDKCECLGNVYGEGICIHHPPFSKPKDTVEEKIDSLKNSYRKFEDRIDLHGFVLDLRGLVRLARETK